MGMNITDTALRFLAAIKHEHGPDRYVEVVRVADAIRRERKATWLGRVHLDLALERMARENSHAA